MHIYESDFLELYNKQPKNLSFLKKLLRIDKLACIEVNVKAEIDKSIDTAWFYVLGIILTQIYLEQVPQLIEFEYLPDIIREQARRQTNLVDLINNRTEELKATIEYIQMRMEMLLFLHENCCD